MSKKVYVILNIALGLLKAAALVAIVLWLLPLGGIHIPMWGLILLIVALVIYEIITIRLGWKALKRKPTASLKALVGCCGIATTQLNPHGYVHIQGELWRALSSDTNIKEGDDIIVVEVNRLTLHVAPLSETAMASAAKPNPKLG